VEKLSTGWGGGLPFWRRRAIMQPGRLYQDTHEKIAALSSDRATLHTVRHQIAEQGNSELVKKVKEGS
jgi:hypothetical protein